MIYYLLFALIMLVFLVFGFLGAGYHPVSNTTALPYLALFYIATLVGAGTFLFVGVSALGLTKSCTAAISLDKNQFERILYYDYYDEQDFVGKLNRSRKGLIVIGILSIILSVYFFALVIMTTIHMSFSFFRQV